jgi:hypothetical protein
MPDTEVILEIFGDNPELWFEHKEKSIPTPSWELEFSEKIMNVYVTSMRSLATFVSNKV